MDTKRAREYNKEMFPIINKTTKITIKEELHDEFMRTALEIEGYKRGRKRISVENAVRLYLNYAKPYKDKRLYQVAHENNMEVWEVGQHLIKMFMTIHTELGIGLDFITNKEHCEMVKKYMEEN